MFDDSLSSVDQRAWEYRQLQKLYREKPWLWAAHPRLMRGDSGVVKRVDTEGGGLMSLISRQIAVHVYLKDPETDLQWVMLVDCSAITAPTLFHVIGFAVEQTGFPEEYVAAIITKESSPFGIREDNVRLRIYEPRKTFKVSLDALRSSEAAEILLQAYEERKVPAQKK